jgi:hypothetical protein
MSDRWTYCQAASQVTAITNAISKGNWQKMGLEVFSGEGSGVPIPELCPDGS